MSIFIELIYYGQVLGRHIGCLGDRVYQEIMSLILTKGMVYVVDDDKFIRDSIHWLLLGHGYHVICFESGEQFLTQCDSNQTACLITDVRLSGMSGLELLSQLKAAQSPIPVALMTGQADIALAVTALKNGAFDLIQKPYQVNELLDLVERLTSQATQNFDKQSRGTTRHRLLSQLTRRESQVLELIISGRLNKQIASELEISMKTVETHRKHLMTKLRAKTVADLMKITLNHMSLIS